MKIYTPQEMLIGVLEEHAGKVFTPEEENEVIALVRTPWNSIAEAAAKLLLLAEQIGDRPRPDVENV